MIHTASVRGSLRCYLQQCPRACMTRVRCKIIEHTAVPSDLQMKSCHKQQLLHVFAFCMVQHSSPKLGGTRRAKAE